MRKDQQCTGNFQNSSANTDKMRQNATNVLYNFQMNAQNPLLKYPEFMSIKISVVLETRRVKSNGKFPVCIRFNFKNQAYYVGTGVDVPKENFMQGRVVGMPRASVFNNIIAQKFEYTQNVLEDLQFRGLLKTKFQTGTEIKRFIESGEAGYENIDRDERMKLHFKSYVENHLLKYKSNSSAEQYRGMLSKVGTFSNLDILLITDITTSWLKDFEIFCLKTGMTVNGVAFYMRAIRVIYNDAIDRDLVPLDKYPFRRYKIKKSDTIHRNMSLSDIKLLINYNSTETPGITKSIDLFMLSFYLCGMNMKDIVFLKKSDIRDGNISILRGKTQVPILIRLEPEALAIIKKYPGKKHLLNYMDDRINYADFRRRINQYLKKILPYLTNYWARHTWATFAGELNIPDPIIDMAQGHKLKGMSSIYINRNINKVYEANRKVINYISKK